MAFTGPGRLNSIPAPNAFSFPSGHATMAAITFGVLAVLASHAMNRWSRSLVYATCGLIVITIAYSRVYLGVHWLSDVMGGVMFGGVMVAAFGVAIEAIPPRRIMPLGLLGATFIAFVVAGGLNISNNFDKAEKFYAAPEQSYSITPAEWETAAWQQLPERRIDLAGKPEEPFIMQWAGSLEDLQKILESRSWVYSPKWTWRDSIPYLDPNAVLGGVAPRPALHLGLKAKLTMTLALNGETNRRLVMRAYKTNANLKSAQSERRSSSSASPRKACARACGPMSFQPSWRQMPQQVAEFENDMALPSNTRTVTEQRPGDGGQVQLITLP